MTRLSIKGSAAYLAVTAVVAGLLSLLPLSGSVSGLIVRTLLFVGLAVSWNILGGMAGQLHIGHAAFFGIGAYVAAWFIANIPLGPATPWVAMGVAGLAGLVLVPLLIPAFRARGAYFAILTLAFTSVLGQLAQAYAPGGNSGIFFDAFAIGSAPPLVAAVLLVGLTLWASWLLGISRIGRGLVAVRMDIDAARSLGVDDLRVRTIAMAISGCLGAAMGGLYATNLGYLDPPTAFALDWSVFPLLAAMLGGRGTIVGPVLGALVWTGLDEFVGRMGLDAGMAFILQGGLLWGMALGAPSGIWGIMEQWRHRRLADARATVGPEPAEASAFARSASGPSTDAENS